jgi:hypothetical protein
MDCFLWGPCRGVIFTVDATEVSQTRVEAGSNTFTVTLRVVGGDEKGSLKYETLKYGHENKGTRTQEALRWREPVACTKDRRVISSEGAPQKQNRDCQKVINIWS